MADQVYTELESKGVNAVILSSEGREGRVGTASEDTLASASLIFSSQPECAVCVGECV